MAMNLLVIGSGGREHALVWKLKQSPLAGEIFCAPGNGGIAQHATCVSLSGHDDIAAFCAEKNIGLVIIGPEQPLVEGLGDALRAKNIPVFGPGKDGAQLEGSKAFTKSLCDRYNIPTAAYGKFTEAAPAKAYLDGKEFPIVVKADGLAAGKGVIIAQDRKEAEEAVDSIFSGQFGDAGNTLVIEEFLDGEEASFFALCDGKIAIEFGAAQDHKRVGDGDTGPNTGGMGTYSPAPVMTRALCDEVMKTIIQPTVDGLKKDGIEFQGIFFAGLMLTKSGPKLLEYNTRFGDPETQVLMPRLKSDLVELMLAVATGTLAGKTVEFVDDAAVCVVMAANGYPGAYEKGTRIRALDKAGNLADTIIFHAGTQAKDGAILATGGRVLGVTATGSSIKDAQAKAYRAVDTIEWPQGFCRRDIAWRALSAA